MSESADRAREILVRGTFEEACIKKLQADNRVYALREQLAAAEKEQKLMEAQTDELGREVLKWIRLQAITPDAA